MAHKVTVVLTIDSMRLFFPLRLRNSNTSFLFQVWMICDMVSVYPRVSSLVQNSRLRKKSVMQGCLSMILDVELALIHKLRVQVVDLITGWGFMPGLVGRGAADMAWRRRRMEAMAFVVVVVVKYIV